MARFPAWLWLALPFLTACTSGDGPFIHGTIYVDPCPPGPTADACATELVPENCVELTPRYHWVGGHLHEPSASVTLTGTERVGITDIHGEFLFSRLEPGTVALTVSVPNTVETRIVQVVEVAEEQVDNDYGEDVIAISFTAAGTIEGRVALPRTLPHDDHEYGDLEAVEVQMVCPPRNAVTDAEGRFRFDNVPQGTRHLTATGIGLVGTADPVLVLRGQTSDLELQLEYGRPPDQPGNLSPVINGPITFTPLTENTAGVTFIRPPAEGLVRGQSVALECSASDPDGDVLQYVWSASSGALEAFNAPTAVLTAGSEDIGVSCTVLDGRGGVAATHQVLPVQDTFFAGASLFSDGAVVSVAYGADFDLVLWTPTLAAHLPQSGDQWLPRASGSVVAFVDRASGVDALIVGALEPGGLPPISSQQVAEDVVAFAATDHGVAWIDDGGTARFRDRDGLLSVVTTGLDPEVDTHIACNSDTVAVSRYDTVELYRVGTGAPWFFNVILTPVRINTNPPDPDNPPPSQPFATDGGRVAYWSWEGRPMLATPSTEIELGNDEIGWGRSGRFELSEDYAAYSYYDSPLEFVEATVIWLENDQPVHSERAAIGPSEVLDLDGQRLLLGRSRSNENQPSKDLWIVDLESLVVEQ